MRILPRPARLPIPSPREPLYDEILAFCCPECGAVPFRKCRGCSAALGQVHADRYDLAVR